MRNLPDFNIELSQAIDFIMDSNIAKKAFEREPFSNFTNLIRMLLASIDRLADNCHMPEFTNHAMPHICSLIKRASEWGVNNGWLSHISSEEAGMLLLAIISHDIGMLSQDAKNLPDSDAINSRKGLADLANWTRQTHVIRLKKLLLLIMEESGCLNDANRKYIKLAADMGATHSCWPKDKRFDCKVFKHARIRKSNIMALCAVIAVVDLLDEDTSRCDTETLVKHKRGNSENIAHWARHTLTVNVSEIKNNCVDVTLQDLSDTPKDFDNIYLALKNHYRLIMLYNDVLQAIDATINVKFDKRNTISFNEFALWADIAEFKNNVVDRLMQTFMNEARGIPSTYVTVDKLYEIGIEEVAFPLKRLEENILSIEESAFLLNKDYSYMQMQAEQALLDGQIGTARNIAAYVFEKTNPENEDIAKWFWAATILLKYHKKDWEISIVDRKLGKKLNENTDYFMLLKNVLVFLRDSIYHNKTKGDNITADILTITGTDLVYSFSTNMLLEFVIELVWVFNDTALVDVIGHFIDIYSNRGFDVTFLTTLKNRIMLQIDLLDGSRSADNVSLTDRFEVLIAQSWAHVFRAEWDALGEVLTKASQTIRHDNQYFLSLQVLYNIYSLPISASKGKLQPHEESNYYRYQQLVVESPLRVFEEERDAHIHYLFREIATSPYSTNAAASRKELFRLIQVSTLSALKYWDLGSLFTLRKYEAEMHISLGICYDENNNYSGYIDSCYKAIIASISSMDTKFVKDHTEEIKTCISLLDNKSPESTREIYKYIFLYAKPIEFINAHKVITLLGDRISEDLVTSFVDWSIQHYNFEKTNWLFGSDKSFNYFVDILSNIKMDKKQWNKLYCIFEDMITLRRYFNQKDLYKTIFTQCPKSQSISLMTKALVSHLVDDTELHYLANAVFNAGIDRKEISDHCIEIITQIYNKTKQPEYQNLIQWLKKRFVDKQDEFDFNALYTELNTTLSSILDNGQNGIIYGYDHSSFITLCANSNWKLSIPEEREKFFVSITDAITSSVGKISLSDFDTLIKALRAVTLRFDIHYKKRLVKFIIGLIESDYKARDDMRFRYSPLSTTSFTYKNLSEYNSFVFIIGEFGVFCNNGDRERILNWLEREFHSVLSEGTLYYTTYTLLSIYEFGDAKCRQRAGYFLSSVLTNYHMSSYDVRNEMLVNVTRAVFHNIKNTVRYGKGLARKRDNPQYAKLNGFVSVIIKNSSTALSDDARLSCAGIINLLIKNGNYSITDFEDEIAKLASDNCAGIRNALKHT